MSVSSIKKSTGGKNPGRSGLRAGQRTWPPVVALFGLLLSLWACPHKPQDPGLLEDLETGLFSLPAELTKGVMQTRLAKYKTRGQPGDGSGQEVVRETTYDPDTRITYQTVGAQVQYYKIKPHPDDKAFTIYQPRYVISGALSQQDISKRQNILILSIMAGTFTKQGFPSNMDDFDVAGSGYDRDAYCVKEGEFDGFQQCSDAVFHQGNTTVARDYSSTGYELFNNWHSPDTDSASYKAARQFNVVMEYIDEDGTIYTTIFPYSRDLDFAGNHTNAKLKVQNFPSGTPPFTGNENDETITNIATYDPNQTSFDVLESENCTGFYDEPASGDTLDSENYLKARGSCQQLTTLLADSSRINANGSQSSQRNDIAHCSDKFGDGQRDFICMHFMQEAGREHKAEGTDADPLKEFVILGLEFSVQRAEDRYIEDKLE